MILGDKAVGKTAFLDCKAKCIQRSANLLERFNIVSIHNKWALNQSLSLKSRPFIESIIGKYQAELEIRSIHSGIPSAALLLFICLMVFSLLLSYKKAKLLKCLKMDSN